MHVHPTKIELINEICSLVPKYKENLGRLHYMSRDELIRKLKRIKVKLGLVKWEKYYYGCQ